MWDWITFVICVASIVPSMLLIGMLLRYLLKHSERRCFKDSSEDCEILVSTHTVRPRPSTREILQQFTRREVVVNVIHPGSSAETRSSLQLVDSPPEYSTTNPRTLSFPASHHTPPLTEHQPPIYGSQTNSGVLSSVSSLYGRLLPHNLNTLITSLDILPEFANVPPPPTYDEVLREVPVVRL